MPFQFFSALGILVWNHKRTRERITYNTEGNISCQLMPFIDFERVDPFDQTNRTNADEVFGLFTADIELLYDGRD